MSNRIRLRDGIIAEAFSAGSVIAGKVPVISRRLGTLDSIEDKPVRWLHARQAAFDPAFGEWPHRAGNKKAGRTPLGYPEIALFTFDKEATDRLTNMYDGQHAGAYVLGKSAVMFGISEWIDVFGTDPTDDGRYAMGMRIGKGLFRGMPVVEVHDRVISPIHGGALAVEFMRRDAADPTIPII